MQRIFRADEMHCVSISSVGTLPTSKNTPLRGWGIFLLFKKLIQVHARISLALPNV